MSYRIYFYQSIIDACTLCEFLVIGRGSLQGCLGDTIRDLHFFNNQYIYSIMKTKILIFAVALIALLSCSEKNAPSNPNAENGELVGLFSIGADKQIHFSQGNLQYNPQSKTWQFAKNQWDIIGNDNKNISYDYDGWIDLFGWGTGKNPTLVTMDSNDYSTFSEWGDNAISNGGNQINQWRTLTKEEWVYLFRGRKNAQELFGFGKVAGVNGIIILPDDWKKSNAINIPGFVASTREDKGLKWQNSGQYGGDGYYSNDNGNNYEHNTYSSSEWHKMEEQGAVFLPAAGARGSAEMYNVGSTGYYMSTTPRGTEDAFGISFDTNLFLIQGEYGREYGRSVRLVR